ncbi:hypothetical protein SAMN02745174_02203 [Cetobacterium ceti]|uniref:Uncharacterized protein n=1 Tax=Cetobacterium ceti TaxID=180163 RepID=A0A1T4Q8E0_9FUSO|nr:hypothetical protein [Cetobacterium ceti]SJZ99478.1 hypothetical protein SAMN02745174_02203 [Cetobacterium ceti]
MEKKDKYIHKFRCSKCGCLLGGATKDGYIKSNPNIKHYTSWSGEEHIFICEKRDDKHKICGTKTIFSMKEIREKLKSRNYEK